MHPAAAAVTPPGWYSSGPSLIRKQMCIDGLGCKSGRIGLPGTIFQVVSYDRSPEKC